MELNRVSAPNDGATGIDLANDPSASGGAAGGRAALTMMRTHDVKVWRGTELGDKARLRIALPLGKMLAQPTNGGWFSRVRQMMQARSERVQNQSTQRLAALTLDSSPALQGGPRWLRSIGTFRGQLQSLSALLKEQAAMQAAPQASAAAVAAAAASLAAASNPDSAALAQVTAAVQQRFTAQAGNKEAFTALLKQAFGDKFDAGKAETIRQQALAGDFSWAPKVQVVDSKTLADLSGTQAAGSAQGAYVQETDTIYISRELLQSDPAQAQRILMEEIGHGIDARINTQDAVGDEGEIFSKLMHGDAISTQEMAALKADNDHGVVNINGKNVTVEYGWFKKLTKAITGGIKNVVSAVAKGVVNLAKSAVKVTVGLATFNFDKVKEGFKEGVSAVKTTVKTVAKAIKDTAKEIHKVTKEAFMKIMQSKLFAVVLMICRFIPIPIVALVVRIIDVVRAAYMVYQGVKNKSLSMVLGGIASLASGGAKLAGSFGASLATVNTIKAVADAASKLSMAYNAVANKDIGSALGLLGGAVGGPGASPTMNNLVTVGGYVQQAVTIGQAVKNKDALGALGGVVGMASSYNNSSASGSDSATGQQLANAQEVVTGLRAVREISRGNLDAAQSLAASMNSAQQASQQADAISVQRRADEAAAEQAANNRSLLNAADKDLRALPAEQKDTPTAGNDYRNGSDVNSDNTAIRNGGVGPVGTQSLLTVGKGQTLEGIARAQYGENWKAGLAQITLDNGLKLNQWGSPVLGIGKTLVLNDISGKSEQELASLSRTGGRIISNNDKGLQAKADLAERARQAAAQKVQEATVLAAANTSAATSSPGFNFPMSSSDPSDALGLQSFSTVAAGVRGGAYGAYEPSFRDFSSKKFQEYSNDSPGNRLVDAFGREQYNNNTGAKATEVLAGINSGRLSAQQGAYEAATYRDGQTLFARETSSSPETLAKIARERGDKPTDAVAERMKDPSVMRDYVDRKLYPKTEEKLREQGKTPTPDEVYREIVESSGRPNAEWNAKAAQRSALASEIRGAGQIIGRTATVVGAVSDTVSLAQEVNTSVKTGNYDNTYKEGARIAGGWTGAWVAGKAGAATGAFAGGAAGSFFPIVGNGVGVAIGGVLGGLIGGATGYWAGGKLGTATYEATKP